jgi:hypothetical protein
MYGTINSTGASGTTYAFKLQPIGTALDPVAGVYMFLRNTSQGQWDAIYIGEARNFNERLNTGLQSHHAWDCVQRHGATHISTLPVGGDIQARINIETDLRHSHNPPCNMQ